MKPRTPSQAEIKFAATETRAAIAPAYDIEAMTKAGENLEHWLTLFAECTPRDEFRDIVKMWRARILQVFLDKYPDAARGPTSATGGSALKQTSRDGATNTERGSDHEQQMRC